MTEPNQRRWASITVEAGGDRTVDLDDTTTVVWLLRQGLIRVVRVDRPLVALDATAEGGARIYTPVHLEITDLSSGEILVDAMPSPPVEEEAEPEGDAPLIIVAPDGDDDVLPPENDADPATPPSEPVKMPWPVDLHKHVWRCHVWPEGLVSPDYLEEYHLAQHWLDAASGDPLHVHPHQTAADLDAPPTIEDDGLVVFPEDVVIVDDDDPEDDAAVEDLMTFLRDRMNITVSPSQGEAIRSALIDAIETVAQQVSGAMNVISGSEWFRRLLTPAPPEAAGFHQHHVVGSAYSVPWVHAHLNPEPGHAHPNDNPSLTAMVPRMTTTEDVVVEIEVDPDDRDPWQNDDPYAPNVGDRVFYEVDGRNGLRYYLPAEVVVTHNSHPGDYPDGRRNPLPRPEDEWHVHLRVSSPGGHGTRLRGGDEEPQSEAFPDASFMVPGAGSYVEWNVPYDSHASARSWRYLEQPGVEIPSEDDMTLAHVARLRDIVVGAPHAAEPVVPDLGEGTF